MELYFRACYQALPIAGCRKTMPKTPFDTLRDPFRAAHRASAAVLVSAALLATGCASDADPAALVASNQPGTLTPAAPATPGPAAPTPSAGAGESPASEPPPAEQPQPQPNATETNFFTAGCRQDADCGDGRRCELPAATADRAAAPPSVAVDAGASADAGAEPPPPGRCVPR